MRHRFCNNGWHGQLYSDARAFASVLFLLIFASSARADILNPTTFQTLQLQIALDREGFSPGILDGKIGPKCALAKAEFAKRFDLSETASLSALQIGQRDPL